MTALSLSQAAGATGVAKITIAGALKSRWHAATRKQDGGYEIDTVSGCVGATGAHYPLAQGRRGEGRTPELRQQLFGRAATGGPENGAR